MSKYLNSATSVFCAYECCCCDVRVFVRILEPVIGASDQIQGSGVNRKWAINPFAIWTEFGNEGAFHQLI